MVIDADGQRHLRAVLPDDILVELFLDLAGTDERGRALAGGRNGRFVLIELASLLAAAVIGAVPGTGRIIVEIVQAQLDAFIADIDAGTGDQAANLFLTLPAEGTAHMLFFVFSHEIPRLINLPLLDNLIDDAVFGRLGSREEMVALGIRADLLIGFTRALGQDPV